MADPSTAPVTVGDFLAKLSEFYPYGEEPPRLCAALNDARTDAPEGTTFDPTTGVALEHKIEPPFSATTITSVLDWIAMRLDRPLGEAWLTQIPCAMKWTAPEMAAGEEELWAEAVAEVFLGLTYSGPLQLYNMGAPNIPPRVGGGTPPSAAGESWEQFMFHRICKSYPRQRFHVVGNTAHGAHYVKQWDDPTPLASSSGEAEWELHDNTDPAAPVGVACQHMTTYGALTRGIPLEWLGDATNPAAGFMASDACKGMPAFGDLTSPGGRSPMGGAGQAGLVQAPASPGKWVTATPELTRIDKAMEAGLAPGTIIVLDPDTAVKTGPITFYLSKYEQQSHMYRSVLRDYFFTRAKVGGDTFDDTFLKPERKAPSAKYVADIEGKQKKNEEKITRLTADITALEKKLGEAQKPDEKQKTKAELDKKNAMLAEATKQREYLAQQKTLAADASTSAFIYKLNEQLPGSHIYFVLRVHKDKKAYQSFNVSVGEGLGHLTPTHSEAILGTQGDGHIDGYREASIGAGDGRQFAGIGVLPTVTGLGEKAMFLRQARPIGLARLVIAERARVVGKKVYPGLADKNQILYASRLLMMYGPQPTQSYPVSRLLWALRNAPGFTNLQCWWMIFAPQGLLAKCMWAEGSRAMTLKTFMDTLPENPDWGCVSFFQPGYASYAPSKRPPSDAEIENRRKKSVRSLNYNQHYVPCVVLTNDGSRDAAGKAGFFCRFKGGEGSTQGQGVPQDAPGPLTSLLKTLAWDQIYLRRDLEAARDAIEGATPPFFKGFSGDQANDTGTPAV